MHPYMYVIGPLPRGTSGKIDAKSLVVPKPSTLLVQPPSVTGKSASVVPPSNRIETELLQVFCSVLHLEGREAYVGVESGFFELGGNSLLAARLLTRIQSHFGISLPISSLFSSSTVRLLAKDLRQKRPGTPTIIAHNPLMVIQEGDKSPIFCVHPAGGNAMCFYPLAAEMKGHTVYALEDPNGGEEDTYLYSNLYELAKGMHAYKLLAIILIDFSSICSSNQTSPAQRAILLNRI